MIPVENRLPQLRQTAINTTRLLSIASGRCKQKANHLAEIVKSLAGQKVVFAPDSV